MAKRRKTITAGRLVSEIAYTVAHPRDPEHIRQAKSKMSSKARQKQNLKAACRALELLIAANFTGHDFMVTVTYRDADLPADRQSAVKCLREFFRHLRAYRKARGQDLKYIYVTESKHEHGRWHHHIVMNSTGTDLEIIKSLWRWGDDIGLEQIDVRHYKALAEYLAKEPKETGASNGKRMWVPSRNLARPVQKCDWIDERMTLEPPPGATILESSSERNEFGEYVYLKYLLPGQKPRPCRPSRRKVHKDAFLSGLEPCISYGTGVPKSCTGGRQEAEKRV